MLQAKTQFSDQLRKRLQHLLDPHTSTDQSGGTPDLAKAVTTTLTEHKIFKTLGVLPSIVANVCQSMPPKMKKQPQSFRSTPTARESSNGAENKGAYHYSDIFEGKLRQEVANTQGHQYYYCIGNDASPGPGNDQSQLYNATTRHLVETTGNNLARKELVIKAIIVNSQTDKTSREGSLVYRMVR